MGPQDAILTCALYLFIPSVNLITLHADQSLYPLLFVSSIFISSYSYKKRYILISFITGAFIYLTVFFTFALLFSIPFVIGISYWLSKEKNGDIDHLLFIRRLIFIGCGFISFDILFRILFNYDILLRYDNAMVHHIAWKRWIPSFTNTIKYAKLNLIEYIVWLGIPLFTLALVSFYRSIQNLIKKNVDLISIQSLVLFVTLFVMAFFGKTKGEVARLWLFLAPCMCIVAMHEISARYNKDKIFLFWLLVFLQLGTVYLTKVNQDFW
jgi:hypothetical protein